jgi:rhodanese-related sulfurtransferase/DNA-binding transcriptional ArsR family regulator
MKTRNTGRRHKDLLYEQFARVGRAVSSSSRLEILDLLGQAPRTVEALAAQAQLSVANTSQHLQVLRSAGLVASTKEGLFVTYRLATEDVADFYRALRSLAAERLLEIERVTRAYLPSSDTLEPARRGWLLKAARAGRVTVLDVRPVEEYRAGHLPAAVSVPLKELEKRLAEIPRGRKVVAYCRGPYCVMAGEAVVILRRRGFEAFRLEDGVHEWKASGFEVVSGAAS